MLTDLVVEGLGVIERAELELGRGCSALTGETGAGKTLLVAALGLLLGGRAERTLVRAGAPRASVEGRFLVPASHPAAALVRALGEGNHGDGSEAAEIVLARSVGADGRTSARINGGLVTGATLGEVGGALVEVAGQHEHVRITTPGRQREMLDAFAGEETPALAARVAATVRAAAGAGREIESLAAEESTRGDELQALEREIVDLEAAGIKTGEEDDLLARVALLEHGEAIAAGAAAAVDDLRREGGSHELLERAARALEDVAHADPALGPLAERLRSAAVEADDVAAELRARVVAPDERELEALRDRLALVARLRRRYGLGDDAEAHLEGARRRAEELRAAAAGAEARARRRDELREEAQGLAERLSARRREAAPRLARAVEEVLSGLALPEARCEARLEARALFEGGLESVELFLAADPGEEPRPLARVASGGELARVALALHLVTASEGPGTTVFDEVDAGIGGEAAQAVGRCLAELPRASGAQVLVVTHLPQVAAFADTHYRVTKSARGERATASVARVEDDERIAELSRMLAGLPSSERARGHARELLELAAARGGR
jgi:DNA repair protein RecN (Recombination protein N)